MKLLRVHKKQNLWLLSTPRTGSHYLSAILNECLGYHAFDEWLGIQTPWYKGKKKIQYSDLPDHVNLHWHQSRRIFGETSYEFLRELVPHNKFVVMRRRNMLSQTASFCIATKSKVWQIRGNKQLDNYQNKQLIIKDEDILDSYEFLRRCSNAWGDFIENGCICCYYEDLYADPYPIVEEITNLMGINYNVKQAVSNVQKKFKRTHRKETEQVKARLQEILSFSETN